LLKTINLMKADKESLQPQVEELKKEKDHLEAQVDEQVKKKTYLDDEVKHLKEVKNTLNKAIDALPNLEKLVARFEQEAAELKARDVTLANEVTLKEKQIAEMDKKLNTAGDLDKEIGKKKAQLQELEVRVDAVGHKYKLFEAFLGLVGSKSAVEVEYFLKSAEALINEAKAGNYDHAYLVDQVIGRLTDDAFDLTVCKNCGAEFVIIKSGKEQLLSSVSLINQWCRNCGGIHTSVKKKLLVPTLKNVIVRQSQITLIETGQVTPEEKTEGQDYSE